MNANSRTTAEVEMVLVSSIRIAPSRIRPKVVKVNRIAKSIDKLGLHQAIIVMDDGLLVIGECRLAAVKKLGWKKIPAKRYAHLTAEQLVEIEISENRDRTDLDLADIDRALVKERVRVLKEFRTESVQNPKGGRPKGGTRAAAKEMGVPAETLRKAKQHIETIDEFPAMQGNGWRKTHVLSARESLEKIPKKQRKTAAAMTTEMGIPPKTAIDMLERLGEMSAVTRDETIALYKSGDKEKQSIAKTRAAAVPPAPDPRIADLSEAVRWLKLAAKRRDDGHTEDLKVLVEGARKALDKVRSEYQRFRDREMAI